MRSTPGWPGSSRRVAFERYVDDAVIHCVSEAQARHVLAALTERMREVGLELHPDKTRIVYCKDGKRRGSYEHTAFTFLGFTFRPRPVRTKTGQMFLGFNPAISKDALNRLSAEVRSWRLHRRTGHTEAELARKINPVVRGWMAYYVCRGKCWMVRVEVKDLYLRLYRSRAVKLRTV
jgi:RNA-directed DNA polymerase